MFRYIRIFCRFDGLHSNHVRYNVAGSMLNENCHLPSVRSFPELQIWVLDLHTASYLL